MSTFYLDYENGSDSNNGSTWALAWKTITDGATAARIAPGDIIRIAKSPAPSSIGNADWTNLSKTVTLATAQTLSVCLCESQWSNGEGSSSLNSSPKQGTYGHTCTTPATPTQSTKQTYFATGTLDLSSYQKLSFWFKNPVVINDASTLKICLCSDTAGNTIVDTFWVPAIPSTNQWLPLTITKSGGGSLGGSIQSIAIYSGTTTPSGSQAFQVDDFVACTTNGLNLQSLISKSSAEQSGGTADWYGIKSIDGTTVVLDNTVNDTSATGRGYSGTTETVTTYKRETIKTAMASATSTNVQIINDSGTLAGGNISFQGGYDTGTSEQTGTTFFDGLNGFGYGLYASAKTYLTIAHIGLVRYYNGLRLLNSYYSNVSSINANNNTYYNVYSTGYVNNYSSFMCNNSGNSSFYSISTGHCVFTGIICLSSTSNGLYLAADDHNNQYINLTVKNNTSFGLSLGGASNNVFKSFVSSDNDGGAITTGNPENFFIGAQISESTEIINNVSANNRTYFHDHDGTTGNHWIFTDGGTMNAQTEIRHTASGIAWKINVDSTTRNSNNPLDFRLARIAVAANALVTVKCWFKKYSATGLIGKLVCRGGQIAGVPDDVTATCANNTDWQELTITFTPTAVGVVDIEAWGIYSTSTEYIVVDDMTITQA